MSDLDYDRGTATRRLLLRMPAELHDALKERAAHDERSMAQAIRFAVRQYVTSKEVGSTSPTIARELPRATTRS